MNNIYSVIPNGTQVNVQDLQANPNLLPDGYTSFTTVQVGADTILYAFNKSTKTTDAYKVSAQAPYLTKVLDGFTGLDLYNWDSLQSFVLGNKPYLMTYESHHGFFGFYEIKEDYSVSHPYTFMNQRSWPTQGFSEVSAFVAVGLMYVLCYDKSKGTVAIFSLDVVATSAGGVPPLNMLNVWYHQWAKEWQNFSFFTLGQSNFFFKINKGPKLNVNIDHVLDNPALGSVEIGSYLQDLLPNAKDVSLACIIPWMHGEPYLATLDGVTNNLHVYNIHADCQGWTLLNTTPINASKSMLAYKLGDVSYILTYA
jgi:hypothetical protein